MGGPVESRPGSGREVDALRHITKPLWDKPFRCFKNPTALSELTIHNGRYRTFSFWGGLQADPGGPEFWNITATL